jgi:hypothetical protein
VKVNVLEPRASGDGPLIEIEAGVQAMFMAAQSVAVPSRRPNWPGAGVTGCRSAMSARVNVTEVIEVEAEGVAREKLNKKSLKDGPVPLKQFAVTPFSVVLPHDVKSIALGGDP